MSASPRFAAAGLTDEVLEAAANRGLLRRARRDVEGGLVGPTKWDGGTAVVPCDGETVRLAPGGLGEAACTCPATGACRHVLAAVIALREGSADATNDGDELDAAEAGEAPRPDALAEVRALTPAILAKSFGRAALVRAEALLAGLDPAEVVIDARPEALRIRLGDRPEVHVPAGGGPAGLVSRADRRERATLHAAALLAVLRPETIGASPATTDEPAPVPTPAGESARMLAEVGAVLRDAARQALTGAPVALEERISDLALSSRAETMPRLAAELRTLTATVRRRRERREEEAGAVTLRRIAALYALVEALRTSGGTALGGIVREEAEPLARSRHLGCGVELWRNPSGARGLTVHLLRLDDGRPLSLTLARGAGADPGFSPDIAATNEPLFGTTPVMLGASVFTLEGGALRSGGRLSPTHGEAKRSTEAWAEAAEPHVATDWEILAERLKAALRPSLRARPTGHPALLRPARIAPPAFDAVAQVLRIPVMDASGRWLALEWPADERLDTRIGSWVTVLQARAQPVLCVLARMQGGTVTLAPIAAGAESVIHFDCPAAPPRGKTKRSFFGDWTRRLEAFGFGKNARKPERFEPAPGAPSEARRLTAAIADELVALAELGGRMEDPERLARIERAGGNLRLTGLETPGRLLRELAASDRSHRAHHLLCAVHVLDVLERQEPALPWVSPRPD